MFHSALLALAVLSPSAVVQRFYTQYLAGTAPTSLAREYFTADFARDYLLIIKVQSCLKGKTIIDYDPFFGSQVKNIAAVTGAVSIAGARATVVVKTTMELTKRPFNGLMTVALQRGSDWQISDFIDKDGNSFQKALSADIAGYRRGNWPLSAPERACISAGH